MTEASRRAARKLIMTAFKQSFGKQKKEPGNKNKITTLNNGLMIGKESGK